MIDKGNSRHYVKAMVPLSASTEGGRDVHMGLLLI